MASSEDQQRWWVVPGELVCTIDAAERVVPVLFEYDDGTVWGLRVGAEVALWDHSSSALVLAPRALTADTKKQLRDVFAAMNAPRLGWGVTQVEQATIDKLALGLDEARWTTGRKLRHTLNMTVEEFAPIKGKLIPRYVAEEQGDKGDYYSLTLPGLLRSSERSRVEDVISATLRVIRAKFRADPDVGGFSSEEVIAEGQLDASAGGFIDGVLSAAWLFLGSHGGGQGDALRMNYGMPRDVEDIAKCLSIDDFMKMVRHGRSRLRVWSTAPMRIETRPSANIPLHEDTPSMADGMKYDVTLSFAGEDRNHAEALAEQLRASKVKVFYDLYEQPTLWGKDLYEHLHSVYSEQSAYCVIFVSEHYAKKLWTTHERKAAQERAFRERGGEYILPIRIDETRLPGLSDTIGYVGINEGIERIADMVVAKLRARGDARVADPTTAASTTPRRDGLLPSDAEEAVPELTVRFVTRSMDRDKSGTVVVHHYELVARLVNAPRRRLEDWYLEVELPTSFLEPGTAYGTLVQERSNAHRSVFRTSSKLPPLPAGDPYEWKLPYRVDDKLFWEQHDLLEHAVATARLFVDGALVAETTLRKIQNF